MRAACNAKFANCKSPIGLKTEAVLGKMPPSSEPKLKRARTKADANAEAVANQLLQRQSQLSQHPRRQPQSGVPVLNLKWQA